MRNRQRHQQQSAQLDERGMALIISMIMIMVSMIMVANVAQTALFQMDFTQNTLQSNDALEAAQAGLDVTVGDLRNANSGGTGELALLPCTTPSTTVPGGFTVTGDVAAAGSASYTVTVTYYQQNYDPTSVNLATAGWSAANGLGCSGGSPSAVPGYALMQVTAKDGTQTAPARNVHQTYAFFTTNANIPGGLIYDWCWQKTSAGTCVNDNGGNGDNLCLADPRSSPAVGDTLYTETCTAAGDPEQTWAYNTNFTIELTSTESSTALCLTAGTIVSGEPTTISLQNCPSGTAPTDQQWGVDDASMIEAVSSNGGPFSPDVCITETDNAAGYPINLQTTGCAGNYDTTQAWQPQPAVGAGDSGPSTEQFVNYQEFGRCIDITGQNVNSPYLYDYTCKQFPAGAGANMVQSHGSPTGSCTTGNGDIDYTTGQAWICKSGGWTNVTNYPLWNQRFALEPVQVTVNSVTTNWDMMVTPSTSGTYCIQSTLTQVNLPTNNAWVTVHPCPTVTGGAVPSTDTAYLWNVNTSTTFNILDFDGNCLEADTADPENSPAYSAIATAACNGSAMQRWNAPANYYSAGVVNTFEPGAS